MTDRRRGLGRGLGALLPTAPPESSNGLGASTTASSPVDVLIPERQHPETPPLPAQPPAAFFVELPITSIRPNPRQPRQVFEEEAMSELVASIREVGLLQPVVVRPIGDEEYELVMGERRWRAASLAGLEEIPAIVRATPDVNLLRDALLENLHRSALNPLEEAAAYDQLLADFGSTHDELATRIGRSRPQISNTLRLLKLPPAVQRRVAAGVLSAGHARALLALPEAAAQEHLASRIVAEGMSVRTVEEIVAAGEPAGPEGPRRARLPRPVAPRLADISARLSDRFETRVKVDLGRRRGKITVEFASLDDLERILGLLEPPAPLPTDPRPVQGSPRDEPDPGAPVAPRAPDALDGADERGPNELPALDEPGVGAAFVSRETRPADYDNGAVR